MGIITAQERAVSVLIADSCRMGTQLMASALRNSQSRLEVVGAAITCDEVRSELDRQEVNVAVVSSNLKDGRNAGFGMTREIRSSFPCTDVIMILDVIDRATISQAFCAGAVGMLTRDEPFETLCKSIRAVSQGQVWANSAQLRILLNALIDIPRASSVSGVNAPESSNRLTKSETKLAYLVAEGRTNRDISRQLNLSEHTVRNYLFRIFNKLGTSNRLELALYMIHKKEVNVTLPD